MSTTSDKREVRSKTTPRTDQLRPLNLPQPVTVELGDAGLPTAIAGGVRLSGLCQTRPAGPGLVPVRPEDEEQPDVLSESDAGSKAVESILETWHIDDEWWREPVSRRYVEVILEGGKHVVLYEDLTSNDWFMQMP